MKRKSIQQTIEEFNQSNEIYQPEEFLDRFDYLTNKKRGDWITKAQLLNAYLCGTFGKLFRKLDPIAFECSRDK